MRVVLIALLLLTSASAHVDHGLRQAIPEQSVNYVLNESYPLSMNPEERFVDFLQREEMAAAGNLSGAQRVWRIIQVSDMQLVDDDAPYPIRVGPGDPVFTGAGVSGGAERPHEEYSDEILHSAIDVINAHHQLDPFQFAIHTGDNIDNALENELMRYLDLLEGQHTTVGPISGFTCLPDGQSADLDDSSNDVTESCTSLPSDLVSEVRGLAEDLPWYTMYGNHDGLIQGNVNIGPGMQDYAAQFGRYFLPQDEYIDLHFDDMDRCSGGNDTDDFGHGYGFAGDRLCDENVDNDGYYSFDVANVHFIVLDTVNDEIYQGNQFLVDVPGQSVTGYDGVSGVSEGGMDALQFQWLQEDLEENKDKLTMIFAHHTINAFYTKRFDPACGPPGCADDVLGEAGFIGRDEVHDVIKGYDNMVAFIGGHTHQHRVQPTQFSQDTVPQYWNIETSGLLDTPQETRIIELWQTADQAQLFLALDPIGHTFDLARDVAYSDTSRDHEEKEGTELDRRVLLWIDNPGVDPLPTMTQQSGEFLYLDVLAPEHAHVGNEELIVRLANGQNETVPGLMLTALSLVEGGVGNLMKADTQNMSDLGNGEYGLDLQFNATGEYAFRIDSHDPTGAYEDQFWNINFLVEAHELNEKEGSGPAIMMVILGLAFVAWSRKW